MRIRPASLQDKPAIARLHAASWSDAYAGVLPETYLDSQVHDDLEAHWQQQEITADDVVMVAEKNDQLLGFIAVWCRPGAFIDNLHVVPDHRSRGIGSNLLGVAATSLLVRGHREASLWVFESNQSAINFYLRCGARIVDRQDKSFFGNQLPNLKLAWTDIGSILDALGRERKIRYG